MILNMYIGTQELIVILVFFLIPIILCVKRAKATNREEIGWGILGLFLSYLAVLILYILPPNATRKSKDIQLCPYCGEEISVLAKKCKHCGEWIERK